MKRRTWLAGSAAMITPGISAPGQTQLRLKISLDPQNPGASRGVCPDLIEGDFPVGFGKHGLKAKGEAFEGGYSLLGDFVVNAILSVDRFEMKESLIRESGKSKKWLKEHLFANMSSIDFDLDGRAGEYGIGFLGLEPLDQSVRQPFHFGEYKGVFRWYSYAVHGTQNESRIGQKITGGCVNVSEAPLRKLIAGMQLGDGVRVDAVLPA
jgi:hypothetical protein